MLAVDPADASAAETALAGFDAEGPVGRSPPPPDAGASALGILLGDRALRDVPGRRAVGARGDRSDRFGSARAGSRRGPPPPSGSPPASGGGSLTALTLHADLLHLAGNVVAALIFVSAVGRWLGGGLGAVVILTAAAAANLLTAAVHRTGFVSVGASTATFAALGLARGCRSCGGLRGGARRKYAWVPLGRRAGALRDAGGRPGADTYAHLFGLGLGAAIGSAAALGNVRAPRTTVQVLLGATALAAIAASWGWALHAIR